jgi:hypothetical protein
MMPELVSSLPGLRAELEQFLDCELVCVSDGFAARAASVLDIPARAEGASVRLLRRLPVFGESERGSLTSRDRLGTGGDRSAAPSHLLLDGQVYALGGGPLVIGRAPTGARTIALSEGLAGISRRHCTLTSEGEQLTLIDHSGFGTFVNGERVAARVSLRAGDRVRLGDPGVELALLTVSESR